jgi:hypothetical protein
MSSLFQASRNMLDLTRKGRIASKFVVSMLYNHCQSIFTNSKEFEKVYCLETLKLYPSKILEF